MDTSWKNTRETLKKFANVLRCNKCGCKPVNAVRYTNCGHFFCSNCIGKDSVCVKCNAPVQPNQIESDHLIKNLISYCNTIAEIVQERDLWNTTISKNLPGSSKVKSQSMVTNVQKKNVPKYNIDKVNLRGETKLHVACIKNQEDYVKNLLAAGASPNTKDHTGWTPLQEVVNYGYTNLCKILLQFGASPNTPGIENRRPLHDAVKHNRLEEVQLLLQHYADKDVFDIHGKKPIDYCEPHSKIWNILMGANGTNSTSEEVVPLNCTLNQSLSILEPVILASNLKETNNKCLKDLTLNNKIKVVSKFQSSVTHVIVETDSNNVVQLSYDVMIALLRGCWLLNTEWIQLGIDINNVLKGDLDVFEVSGTPIKGIPSKARRNAQNQNPGLFDQCHFYFAMQSKNNYYINDILLTKESLTTLVKEGGGTVLTRVPDPETVENGELCIPFHVANQPTHSLYKCTYYIIYVPEKDEPRMQFKMSHIKSLPLIWLIECIEKFTLIDPLELGLK